MKSATALLVAHVLLLLTGIIRELKRNALLNDMAGRNLQEAAASAQHEAQAEQLQQRFAMLQQQIQATLQV